MHGVKLFAAPLIFGITRQPLQLQSFFLNCQLFVIQTGPFPVTIDHRIAKRTAVWRADGLALVAVFVSVVVTSGAGNERPRCRAELRAAMFGMTRDAADSGISMLVNDGRHERFGRVTRSAFLVDAGRKRMTRCARASVRASRNRRRQNQL